MSQIVLIDRARALVELLGEELTARGYSVTRLTDPSDADAAAHEMADEPPAAIVVDLELPDAQPNGLDAMIAFDRWCPESPMLLVTHGDRRSERLIAVAWDAIGAAGAISKASSSRKLLEAIESVVATGTAKVDPALRHVVPARRSHRLTAASYRRLVPHGGHAKMWKALLDSDRPPSYREVAERTGLAISTVRSYRDDLRLELALHGLGSPSLVEMHEFARTVRPLLRPAIENRLPATRGDRLAEAHRGTIRASNERSEGRGAS